MGRAPSARRQAQVADGEVSDSEAVQARRKDGGQVAQCRGDPTCPVVGRDCIMKILHANYARRGVPLSSLAMSKGSRMEPVWSRKSCLQFSGDSGEEKSSPTQTPPGVH